MFPALLLATLATAAVDRPVEPFHAVRSGGSFRVEVKGGDKPALSIDAEDPAEATQLETVVKDGVLGIGCKERCTIKKKITVRVTAVELDALTCAGSGELVATGVKTQELSLSLSGSGGLRWSGPAQTVKLALSGSGGATLEGSASSLALTLAGSGSVDASALPAKDVLVNVAGSGSARVNATALLDASIAGSGSVTYLGSPKITKKVFGSGTVTAAGARPAEGN